MTLSELPLTETQLSRANSIIADTMQCFLDFDYDPLESEVESNVCSYILDAESAIHDYVMNGSDIDTTNEQIICGGGDPDRD